MAEIRYKEFIQENFSILDSETQQPVPYVFNKVQSLYYSMLFDEYKEFNGLREIILKARQEGFSSLILALFTVDFILRPYSVSICISHKKGATELLFKKVKFYITSFCEKNGLSPKEYLATESKGMLENRVNHAMFYIGTAGTKVGGRGGSARNIHFSETAFYQDTELITAQEIVVASAQQVPQDQGMIFIESTANGEGNYYFDEWNRAHEFGSDGKRLSTYAPRFFGWQEFYDKEWVDRKKLDFPTEAMWRQEYPSTADEAFILSGSPYFNVPILQKMLDKAPEPIVQGRLAPDGNFI